MKIIEQSHEIIKFSETPLQDIEVAARTCYKSEDKITETSATRLVKSLNKKGHTAMLEFGRAWVRFITDRGVTHELVRHRLCSFAQESTRYVSYDGNMEFIRPVWIPENMSAVTPHLAYDRFKTACEQVEYNYVYLLDCGWRPEQARTVLNNSLKTEIVVDANFTEWKHIFKLRTNPKAHPQMVALMKPVEEEFARRVPEIFG